MIRLFSTRNVCGNCEAVWTIGARTVMAQLLRDSPEIWVDWFRPAIVCALDVLLGGSNWHGWAVPVFGGLLVGPEDVYGQEVQQG